MADASPTTAWTQPGDAEVADILRTCRTIAVVGASPRLDRPSNGVAQYLIDQGYEVWPVNPRALEVLGRPCAPDLASLPGPPDMVDVFRRQQELPQVARDAVAVGAKVLWLQLGLHNDEAVRIAHEAGLRVVTNRCALVEHRRLLG